MAAQWGQGQQGFQYPMQTGFSGNPQLQQNPQFQPQNPSQFQPQQQFQSGGLGHQTPGGMLPQQTGFTGQRPMGIQQPQQLGFPGGSGFHSQPTGFIGSNVQQQNRPPPPPVPPIPSQFAQPNQGGNFLNFPPPQQPNNNLLNASPGFGGGGLVSQPTGYAGRGPLIAQPTGMIDPRLQMMTQSFMPINTSAPYGAGGVPQLPQQQQNLVSSMAQHNTEQRGAPTQQLSWALTGAEKKKYNDIFRSWDAQNTKFIDGTTALSVFGASGLPKEELAHIWSLADIDDRGKLNIAEFHVAMGLIYRRLNGMPVPDQLPAELVPPSSRDLDKSVDLVKELLKHETRSRSPSSLDAPISRLKTRSFNNSSPSLDANRDATIYKHSDSEPPGGFYKPRSRHVDRDAIRSRDDDDSPAADLSDMRRQLANTANMLDRAAQAEASRTREDQELDQEMDDLKYRVKRVQDDLEYNARPPRTSSKEEERRRLERELLSLMHERIPEVERKIKAREERKEKERRQWARDRDRVNDRHGRYDDRDDYSRRNDERDRPYSRGGDGRDGAYFRGAYDRDDREKDSYRRDRSPSRERDRNRDYERPRSSLGRSPPPPVPAPAASPIRDTPPITQHPKPTPSPKPNTKNMTPAERQAFIKAEGQRLTQARMAALGLAAPASSPIIDTSVEDRLQQEKKEAEEKAKAAEKQAEERERARKERLENARSLKEGRTTPVPPAPTPTVTAPPPAPAPKTIPKAAPTPPKSRAPAPPPPRKAPRIPPVVAAPPTPKPPVPVVPSEPEIDHEEELLRAREAELRKKREEREAQFQAKLRLLEAEEEEAARKEEERYQARLQELKAKTAKVPTPPVEHTPPLTPRVPTPVVQPPTIRPLSAAPPTSAPAISPIPSPALEKSTNPFNRLIKEGSSTSTPSVTNGSTNPWSRPQTAPPPSSDLTRSKSPVPNTVKTNYNTAPSSLDDDWDEIKDIDGSDDSSDDEFIQSRTARANIAEQIFGNMLPRPASAAASAPSTAAPPPPPPPPAPAVISPTVPITPAAAPSSNDVSALMRSIQGGLKLRPAKTVDRSAPPGSGKVLGDAAPLPHVSVSVRSASPPSIVQPHVPEAVPMVNDNSSLSNNRQSVGWFADRAADVGATPVEIQRLPSTMEDDEEDIYQRPSTTDIPEILVDEPVVEPVVEPISDLMADVDKSIQHRVRSLYAFEGDGPEDLSFGENLIIIANPSKTGGDWWHGTIISSRKSGLFPKTYVEVVEPRKAKAIYAYTSDNSDELTFAEGDILSIVDTSEAEWWKVESGGVVFIVPAAYLEVVEDTPSRDGVVKINDNAILQQGLTEHHDYGADDDGSNDSDPDSDSDYLSFDDIDDKELDTTKEVRERERQLVLEAAGLIVNQDVKPPPRPKRRSAPATPRPVPSKNKDLPLVPDPEADPDPEAEGVDNEASLDDAFARYESFRNNQSNLNRLSVVSTDSGTSPASPTPTMSSMAMSPTHSGNGSGEGSGRYAYFLQFLKSGSKTPEGERRSVATLNISAPIMNVSASSQSLPPDNPSRSNSPAFGMSWASLVDKTALEGIPPGERKRQEAIFELINTEVAYVRDLQLIVEVFYSSLLPTLSEKETTVVFANIEDLLLTNTAFLSSLEDRQKECRLYIDKIGDILLTHMPNMGVYMEYCVNQSTAIKVLQSRRETNRELASHLQRIRDENPTTRNLDLSSYLLAPMQRITRYPLLIKQILQYTEVGEEHDAMKTGCGMAERLLAHINETIRDQEGAETLKKISQHLWVGEGRLDLTAPTRYMGARKLLKQGTLLKAKSRRKLHAFLCSDILVLTDESMKTLYRLPIPVAYIQVKESGSRDETTFVVSQAYPRGGDSVALRAPSPRDCQQWIQEIDHTGKRARRAEEKASRDRQRQW